MSETPVYLNNWKEGGFLQMVADFEGIYISPAEYAATEPPYANAEYWRERKREMDAALAQERWQSMNVLLASYGTPSYEGYAFVLFSRDGKLYEVNGSHCSCYGLENQWSPEETTVEALRHRLENGSLGADDYSENMFADELRAALARLETKA
jgi:hypothetical protein